MEGDAAFLYRILASIEPDAQRRSVYERLAEVEDKHTVIWANLIRGGGGRVNNRAISDETFAITLADADDQGRIKLSAGKKRHAVIALR